MTGIIPVDKDKDITSFKTVSRLRGITNEKKAGHGGTLDPMATGVLPVLLGGATRFLDLLPNHKKGYIASFKLGCTTDTLDVTGKILTESEVNCTFKDVEALLSSFRGNIKQLPPMYSAVSSGGVRLYKLARQGVEIQREQRDAFVEKLELTHWDEENNIYTVDVLCSKGTYVRTICDDIGRALGCGAVMTSLRRTIAAGFTLDECITLEQAQQIKDSGGDFSNVLIPIEKALGDYDRVFISAPQSVRFSNGGALDCQRIEKELENKIYRVYSPDGVFLGLGECTGEELAVKKLLVKRD